MLAFKNIKLKFKPRLYNSINNTNTAKLRFYEVKCFTTNYVEEVALYSETPRLAHRNTENRTKTPRQANFRNFANIYIQ